jgi:hypothetical protein
MTEGVVPLLDDIPEYPDWSMTDPLDIPEREGYYQWKREHLVRMDLAKERELETPIDDE